VFLASTEVKLYLFSAMDVLGATGCGTSALLSDSFWSGHNLIQQSA